MNRINAEAGLRIRAARVAKNWLQKDLAKASGLPVRTIGRIERGEVDVRLSTITKIARALKVAVGSIVEGGAGH